MRPFEPVGRQKTERKNMNIPNDPAILLSYINTKLRDSYPSFDELCSDMELDPAQITQKLSQIGYKYNPDHNSFI